jgi:hypothetical protein
MGQNETMLMHVEMENISEYADVAYFRVRSQN